MEEEQWKYIDEDHRYEISSFGNVRNTKSHRILKQAVQNSGHTFVCLSLNGCRRCTPVQRLVMNAFNPIPNSNAYIIHHKDYNKQNNRIDNLEWVKKTTPFKKPLSQELGSLESMLMNNIREILQEWYDSLLITQLQQSNSDNVIIKV